jgi:hypothetical protein
MLRAFALVLVLFIVTVIPADAKPRWVSVEVIEVFCEYQIGQVWVEGDMIYERGSTFSGFKIALSEQDPFPEAEVTLELNFDLNQATGQGRGFGDGFFQPAGVQGRFDGRWQARMVELAPNIWLSPKGHAWTHGTGTLKGWRTKGVSYPVDPAPYAGMCPGGANPLQVRWASLDYKSP